MTTALIWAAVIVYVAAIGALAYLGADLIWWVGALLVVVVIGAIGRRVAPPGFREAQRQKRPDRRRIPRLAAFILLAMVVAPRVRRLRLPEADPAPQPHAGERRPDGCLDLVALHRPTIAAGRLSGRTICALDRSRLRQPLRQDPDELRRRLRAHLGPRVRQVVLDGRVRQAEAVGGRLLRPGDEDRGDHADLAVGRACGGAARALATGAAVSRRADLADTRRPAIRRTALRCGH